MNALICVGGVHRMYRTLTDAINLCGAMKYNAPAMILTYAE